ncbi:IclR family transcriptional regulator [Brevibacillus fulvus]|uniref:Glycerol operon regulatory protein n=1 Tax=Brevibacillus fulvus TaxID=1125967 RepID=A0A938XSJ6_9BACL|nr:IclR family transcriptional regulator [Brevibacillus fulvus]MBM7589613.1 DNA-binding IclR family transcriptional regulator [Brevibacillus fulvus]
MPIIQSVERALQILNLFDEHRSELKITEISSELGLNKSTVHSLLKTLQKYQYIEQNRDTGKYRLGLKLFERGNTVINSLDIQAIAKKHLQELSVKTGHTLHLVVLSGQEGVYIDKVQGTSATIVYSRIGKRVPLHSTGVGKALLAFKAEAELNEILKNYRYIKQTENTIANEAAFRRELRKVKQQGYAVDQEENEPGVVCIAVPVWDYKDEVIAAISLSMPAPRAKTELPDMIVHLKELGRNVSRQMGNQA